MVFKVLRNEKPSPVLPLPKGKRGRTLGRGFSRLNAAVCSRLGIILFLAVWQPLIGLPADVKSLLEEARAYEKGENYGGAERSYRQALALAPDHPEVLKRLGILYQTELKFQESIEVFQRALSISAQYPEVNFFLGASYLGLNQFQKATENFQAELSTSNPHPRCHYYYAIALVPLGRPDDAIAQFNQSLIRNPKDADALYQLGRLHMNASLEVIQKLTDLDPDSFQLHALIGEVYANNHLYEDSLKEYRAALAKRPEAPGIHYALGVAYRNLKQIDEAEKEFVQALREDPNDLRVNLYLGEFAVGRGNYAVAIDHLRVASTAQPGAARPHFLLGKCYHGLKQLDKARSELLVAISADPNDPETRFLLAKVYREQGDAKSSAREMEEFQKLSLAEKQKTYERARTTPQ
jgi:tetratricopeptide (TPR) repeat protein